MTNLISQAFKNKEKKLVTFVTGGDPDLDTSLEIISTIINGYKNWIFRQFTK